MFNWCRKDDAYYGSLAAKAKAAAGDDMSDMSDADPGQLLREMVWPHFKLLSRIVYSAFSSLDVGLGLQQWHSACKMSETPQSSLFWDFV